MAQLKDLIVTGPSRFLNDLYALTIYEGGVKLEDKYYLATNPSGYISDLSTAINGLSVGSSPSQPGDYLVSQYAGASQTSYHRRPVYLVAQGVLGYTTSGKNYAIVMDSSTHKLYVNVPWTDTNTTYTLSGALSSHKFTSTLTAGGSGSGTSTSALELVAGSNITLTDDTTNKKITIAATDTTYSAGTGISINNNRQINAIRPVPVCDTNGYVLTWDNEEECTWSDPSTLYSAGVGLSKSSTTFSLDPAFGVEFIIGTQTAKTGSWTGVSKQAALYDGMQIAYWLPFAGSGNATLNLTMSNGTTTGAVYCYFGGTSRLTTHFGAGNVIYMTYRSNVNIGGTSYTGWWHNADYNTTNTTQFRQYYTHPVVDSGSDFSVYRYQFILTTKTGTVIPISNGNDQATTYTKTMTTDAFDPFMPMYYYSYTDTYTAGATMPSGYMWNFYELFDARYAFNIYASGVAGTTALTANLPVYIKAKYTVSTHTAILQPNSSSNNYLERSSLVQSLPSSNPGSDIIYIFIGYAHDKYRINLHGVHPIYRWDPNTNAMAIFSESIYTSKSAASGGTDVSLVTTGEKYTWNNKKGLPSYSSSDRGKFLVVSEGDGSPAWETLYWSDISNKPEVTEVKLNAKTDSSNYRVLLGPSSPTDGSTSEAYYANTEHKRLSFNPSNGDLLGIGLINGNPLGSLFSVSPDGDGGYLLYDPNDPDYQYQWVTPPNDKVSMTANTGSTALPVLLGPSTYTSGNAYGANYANVSGKQLKFTPSTGNLSGVAQINGSAVTSSPKFTDTLADYISTWYSGQNTGFVKYAYNGAPDLYVESGVGYDDLSHTWNAWPGQGTAMLNINNQTTQTSNNWLTGWNFHAPNMTSSTDMGYANFAAINLGKNGEARNSGSIVFHYAGNNALKNCITFGLSYNDHILQMRAGVSSTNLRTVHVRGNIYAQADLTPNGIGNLVATQDWVKDWVNPTCLIKGTKILMADGTEKNIEDVKRGDEVKSIDINSRKIITAMVISCEKTGLNHEYTTHLFDNGSYIVTYGQHSVYNKTLGHPTDISKFRIGDETYDAEGNVITYAGNMRYYDRSTDVAHYDINTSNNLYFANGILNGKNVFAKYRYMRREEMDIPDSILAVLNRQETANKPAIGYETDSNYFRAIAAKLKEKSTIAKRIEEAKQKLADSDYLVAKFTEGLINTVDWLKAKAERSNWRTAINNDEPLLEAADKAIAAIKAKYQTDNSSVKDRFELFSAWDNAALEYYREWLVEKESDNEPIENIEPREGYWANGLNN